MGGRERIVVAGSMRGELCGVGGCEYGWGGGRGGKGEEMRGRWTRRSSRTLALGGRAR